MDSEVDSGEVNINQFIYERWSGEFLDITISSLNNIFGEHKVLYSMKNGIQLPLSKYIQELEDINKLPKDDKSSKRLLRLKFLQECNKHPILNEFFKLLLCWLNGGGDKPDGVAGPLTYNFSQYNRQHLIFTVSELVGVCSFLNCHPTSAVCVNYS